ncbi:class E sortase [Streptomyces chumphonensis]|uniref:Class E sortase n=2 Tax=Streptomyces chumphonensis TaxID=1214925 RepID=A0A927IDE6_9ACTN|nr:class E sortase [Streptomyces chumphonensis]
MQGDTGGALLPPEPVPDASAAPEPATPDAEEASSPQPAARRASRRRTGSRRRQAPGRRRKPPSKGASRAASTMLITSGLAMVLFVVHEVWWTNVQARAEADEALSRLEQTWTDEPPDPQTVEEAGAFEQGEGFAILRIPALGLASPIAEGTGTEQVLDKGLVGHFTGTGMPADPTGNFALAAHRNTHGEPFREIDRLAPGDKIIVETASASYTYEVAGRIPETPPTDVSVLRPVPGGSPFTTSGRYITLTTCTPEYSTRGRLIVFGELVEERPRSRTA